MSLDQLCLFLWWQPRLLVSGMFLRMPQTPTPFGQPQKDWTIAKACRFSKLFLHNLSKYRFLKFLRSWNFLQKNGSSLYWICTVYVNQQTLKNKLLTLSTPTDAANKKKILRWLQCGLWKILRPSYSLLRASLQLFTFGRLFFNYCFHLVQSFCVDLSVNLHPIHGHEFLLVKQLKHSAKV